MIFDVSLNLKKTYMNNVDPNIITAIIAAITSIITIFLIKPFTDKRLHLFKLREEFKSEQRKKIKNVLALYKSQLLKSCEVLNHRFWNFSSNYPKKWHCVDGDYQKECYYMHSFVFRILSVYARIKIIEDELIYFDTTISTKEDLILLKYFRLFQEVFCDLVIFKGEEYNDRYATDHFFRNHFEKMIDFVIKIDDKNQKSIIDYSEFESKIGKSLNTPVINLFQFIDGISPTESRLRWHRLQLLHLSIMAFLNDFGYDFQYTEKEKLIQLKEKIGGYKLIDNFQLLIRRDKIESQKELMSIIKTVK